MRDEELYQATRRKLRLTKFAIVVAKTASTFQIEDDSDGKAWRVPVDVAPNLSVGDRVAYSVDVRLEVPRVVWMEKALGAPQNKAIVAMENK